MVGEPWLGLVCQDNIPVPWMRNTPGDRYARIGSRHGDCRLVVRRSKDYTLVDHMGSVPVGRQDNRRRESEVGVDMRMMLPLI